MKLDGLLDIIKPNPKKVIPAKAAYDQRLKTLIIKEKVYEDNQ